MINKKTRIELIKNIKFYTQPSINILFLIPDFKLSKRFMCKIKKKYGNLDDIIYYLFTHIDQYEVTFNTVTKNNNGYKIIHSTKHNTNIKFLSKKQFIRYEHKYFYVQIKDIYYFLVGRL